MGDAVKGARPKEAPPVVNELNVPNATLGSLDTQGFLVTAHRPCPHLYATTQSDTILIHGTATLFFLLLFYV